MPNRTATANRITQKNGSDYLDATYRKRRCCAWYKHRCPTRSSVTHALTGHREQHQTSRARVRRNDLNRNWREHRNVPQLSDCIIRSIKIQGQELSPNSRSLLIPHLDEYVKFSATGYDSFVKSLHGNGGAILVIDVLHIGVQRVIFILLHLALVERAHFRARLVRY